MTAFAVALTFGAQVSPSSACGPPDAATQAKAALGAAAREKDAPVPEREIREIRSCGGTPSPSFIEHIHALRNDGLDVVILVNDESPMPPIVSDIETTILSVFNKLRCLVPNARIGIVTYYGKGESPEVQPLTRSPEAVHSFLKSLRTMGCSSPYSGVLDGAKTAVDKMNWNSTARKAIVLIGDEPPEEIDEAPLMHLIHKFRSEKGTVSTLDATPNEDERFVRAFWEKVHHQEPPKVSPLPQFDRKTRRSFRKIADEGAGSMECLLPHDNIGQKILSLSIGIDWDKQLPRVTPPQPARAAN
ncbi:MAG TPA: vWA domain-containing protein [Candidatus Binataceae bacterium]|nr:vWA domain-containing protein [Candidatus Binataceae bacterium]